MSNIYEVIFKERGKKYFFSSEDDIDLNVNVIVDTEKGLQLGRVVNRVENTFGKVPLDDVKSIIRVASEKDYDIYLKNTQEASKAMKNAKKFIKELDLNMNIINVFYAFDRSQLVFNFVSDERIDFRELAKKLASIYKTRIELRQVGAREKAREVSGIGICGRELCCSGFLQHIDSVSMNMAKNQNVSLNPQKINGSCSRLLCCLTYEDEEYKKCNKGLPSVGQKINVDGDVGIVTSVDILNRKVSCMINNEKRVMDFSNESVK